jgi:protein-tyrosine phosphatase
MPCENRPIDGYVDIHAHVLPGIDDGPDDLEQSLAMVRAAVDSGTATIASTPHLRSDFPDVHVHELAGRCQTLRDAIEREQIPLTLISGAEVSLTWAVDATDEELALASYGQHGADLLIETPTRKLHGMDRFLRALRGKGYRVTLGHPERSLDFQRDDGPLRKLVADGVRLQLNADSVLGAGGGHGTERLARKLLTDGVAHVIASDGHRGTRWRPVTRLEAAVELAAELVGPERARWMAQTAPAAILEGAELPDAPAPIEQPRRRRRFGPRRR